MRYINRLFTYLPTYLLNAPTGWAGLGAGSKWKTSEGLGIQPMPSH